MAHEQGRGPSPPPSRQLLDAVLQNLYDFGETEDEAEQKRIRKKKENKKRDAGTPVALGAEPAPPPGAPVRGPRKRASNFFSELREELRCAPSVTPPEAPAGPQAPRAAASPSPLNRREPVEVVEFHSRSKKRKQRPDQDENAKTKTSILEKDVNVQEFNLEKCCSGEQEEQGCASSVMINGLQARVRKKTGASNSTAESSAGGAPVWDHGLRKREGESPGTGACGHAGRTASQEELRELQGFAGADQREKGSQGRGKENGPGHRHFQEKEEERAGGQEIQEEESSSQHFVKWTDWPGWKIQKWDIDPEPRRHQEDKLVPRG
ncbi:uncharacterized protein C1orf131 homolog isoform X1 [Myotis daubentonii]|uniref:uncharacterized protein C1orf131 homolog isoform X1 n=1 Tax=Myotis daubentonii TaxID=98922 RepID=UPI0028732D4C|nr:uncharacterized protein C1orf131 homolog isoform X1 [Myotis daubentonii]